jgi:hypothetical protein
MLCFVSLFCSFVRMFARIECEECDALCVVAATWKLRHCEIALVKKIIMIVDFTIILLVSSRLVIHQNTSSHSFYIYNTRLRASKNSNSEPTMY